VKYVCAEPWNELVERLDVPTEEALGKGDDAVGVKKDIKNEEEEEEPEGELFR